VSIVRAKDEWAQDLHHHARDHALSEENGSGMPAVVEPVMGDSSLLLESRELTRDLRSRQRPTEGRREDEIPVLPRGPRGESLLELVLTMTPECFNAGDRQRDRPSAGSGLRLIQDIPSVLAIGRTPNSHGAALQVDVGPAQRQAFART
jgi:hypothetical protein